MLGWCPAFYNLNLKDVSQESKYNAISTTLPQTSFQRNCDLMYLILNKTSRADLITFPTIHPYQCELLSQGDSFRNPKLKSVLGSKTVPHTWVHALLQLELNVFSCDYPSS